MYIACEKCKYNYDGECDFYNMGSGNEIDMPCYREKELIKEAADNFIQAFVGAEIKPPESDDLVVDEGILALLEKTYDDFCRCEGGEGWLKIDGKEYSTDAGYALEGMRIFMDVFKQRLAESEEVNADSD